MIKNEPLDCNVEVIGDLDNGILVKWRGKNLMKRIQKNMSGGN